MSVSKQLVGFWQSSQPESSDVVQCERYDGRYLAILADYELVGQLRVLCSISKIIINVKQYWAVINNFSIQMPQCTHVQDGRALPKHAIRCVVPEPMWYEDWLESTKICSEPWPQRYSYVSPYNGCCHHAFRMKRTGNGERNKRSQLAHLSSTGRCQG
jgi:hypothetical protein